MTSTAPASVKATPIMSRHITAILPSLPPLPLFSQLPSSLLPSFLSHFHLLSLPSETLFPCSPTLPTFVLVLSGSLASFLSSNPSPSSVHSLLSPGDAFGLSSLLTSSPLTPSFIAVHDAELLCITRPAYDTFLSSLLTSSFPRSSLPSLPSILSLPPSHRSPADLSLLSTLLTSSSLLFHSFDSAPLTRLASSLFLSSCHTGDVLHSAGDEAEYLIILLSGSASVHLPHPSVPRPSSPPQHTTRTGLSTAESTRSRPADHSMEEEKVRDNLSPLLHRRREHKFSLLNDGEGEISPSASFPRLSPSALPLGECVSLLLPTSATDFSDSLLSPTFCALNSHTIVAREPCTFAYLSSTFLCSVLASFHKPQPFYPSILSALSSPPKQRDDEALTSLDALLKTLPFFQFKPSKVRRQLCQCLQYRKMGANRVLHAQGENSELYWIVLSGSVSIHTKEGVVSVYGPAHLPSERQRGEINVSHLSSLIDKFGACQSVARPFTAFNESALIASASTRYLSTSAITRTPCELLCLTRSDYATVCEPTSDLTSHSDVIVKYMKKKEEEKALDEQNKLIVSLLHFQYFADLRQDLRQMVVSAMEWEEVEGEVRLFEEGEETDENSCMFVIVSGSVGVHLADAKQKQRRAEERNKDPPLSSRPPSRPSSRPTSAQKKVSLPPIPSPRPSPLPGGRASVSHLSPTEVTSLYGPSVTVLPTGMHFGDVAFSSSQSCRRSATCITVEPCFLLKLPRDIVQKVNYLSQGARGEGGRGRAGLSQSSVVAALQASSLFGGAMTSLSTLKRMAFHVESRHYKMGDVLAQQGEKAEAVLVIAEGAGTVTRSYCVLPHTNQANLVSSSAGPHQQLHCPSLIVHSPLLNNGKLEFSLPLSTLSVTSVLGAYECLHGTPMTCTFTVTSVECHVLAIRKVHFLNFYGGLFNKLPANIQRNSTENPKGSSRVEEEKKDREKWWAELLHSEIQKRVREAVPREEAQKQIEEEKEEQLTVASLSKSLHAMDISASVAYAHISRFDLLTGLPSETLGGLKEAELIRKQQQSLSKKGGVFDRGAAQKLGKTIEQVRGRVKKNEARMGRKEENLRKARAFVLKQGMAEREEGGLKDRPVEDVQEGHSDDDETVSEWLSGDDRDEKREDETFQFITALEKRRQNGSIIKPNSHKHRQPLSLPPTSPRPFPSHIFPPTQRTTAVPSIPHTTETREDIEEARSQHLHSPSPAPVKSKKGKSQETKVEEEKEEHGGEVRGEAVRRDSENLPSRLRSGSIREWQEEKKAVFEGRKSVGGEEEGGGLGVEGVAGQMRRRASSVGRPESRLESAPSPGELLFHLDRCQRNSFID